MVRKDIKDFIKTIPEGVTIVAASKYVGADDIKVLLDAGIKDIGENRVDSFLSKYELLKDNDIKWHFIGHLQRNKATKVIDKIDYLESLDSLELAKIINSHRLSPLKCFVEVSINLEENKDGVPYYELKDFIKELKQYPNIEVVGLMMMAIRHSEDESLRAQFEKLRLLRDEVEKELDIKLPYLSMGMSEDYKEALLEGATHIRLGRILFDLI
ncbi:MAG: YggS family pyridoxal phosphate-dependent enzyme [Bacilli bacterium]|nr:YggS family pyridoxal phosphate-dependent enzyme [Bacilli bacterium]